MKWFLALILALGLFMSAHHPNDSDLNPYTTKSEGEPLFMSMREADLVKAAHEAQESLSSFRKAIETEKHPNSMASVKALLRDLEDSDTIHLWLGVRQLDEDGFFCFPFEIPTGFRGLKLGELVFIPNEAVEDWMLNDQCMVYGGYSLRLQRSKTPEKLRADFDRHTGIKTFADSAPLENLSL